MDKLKNTPFNKFFFLETHTLFSNRRSLYHLETQNQYVYKEILEKKIKNKIKCKERKNPPTRITNNPNIP